MKWQPIETVPKDGTPVILGWLPNGPPAEFQAEASWKRNGWAGGYIDATHWRPVVSNGDRA